MKWSLLRCCFFFKTELKHLSLYIMVYYNPTNNWVVNSSPPFGPQNPCKMKVFSPKSMGHNRYNPKKMKETWVPEGIYEGITPNVPIYKALFIRAYMASSCGWLVFLAHLHPKHPSNPSDKSLAPREDGDPMDRIGPSSEATKRCEAHDESMGRRVFSFTY